VNSKFIQVEIDPNGGTTFINIGTAQIASVPYALYASLANDLVLPFIKTQAAIGSTLIGLTNSATTGVQGAFTGTSASTDGNAYAITGTISSSSPGGFSSGVRGINNGTGGLGIGVYGSQAGSGWGVYGTTPGGIGVNGNSTSGIGVNGASTSGVGVFGTSSTSNAGRFDNTNTANTADALVANTNGAASSWALRATSTGLQGAGIFTYNNSGGAANALRVTNNGSGAGVSATASGTGSAGLFSNTNAANPVSTVAISTNSTSATALSVSGPGIWGSAIGITNTTSGMEWRTSVNNNTYTVTKIPGSTFSPLQLFSTGGLDFSNSAGTSIMRLLDNTNVGIGNVAPISKLHVTGSVTIQDGTEGLNRIFIDNGAGVGTGRWSSISGAGIVTGTGTTQFIPRWTSPSNIGNSLLFDDGTSIGLGTITPTHRFTVSHGGSTGIGVTSTAGFSVIDLNAANGDAALRYQSAGTTRWNVRNAPGTNDYQIVRNNTLPANVTINNGTGFVGITQTAPAYQLDVLHAGSTGIRSQSSSSFSVVDIDAASGDAALRFQAAGVGQWNTRNRPADDYYEIFELGGGGSRLVIQDATGNVGIGETTNPTYKLDVLHGGSTGIRSRSSGSFSVVDIDAASGDAALRFANAGVNQWNIRNRPADDYYEIFELGGGGSRFVIQDGTGNVGIGETVNPTYKLDVLHGGATGIRSRSSGTFSVIDIDAANGDAALRFAKAGVNQWNTRNRPADDYYEIFELGGGGSRFVIQDGTGNVGVGATVSPTHKLHVQHGGATGIRSESTASYSVIDIDGFNGDAALRFFQQGTSGAAFRWVTRNAPGTNNYEIFGNNGASLFTDINYTTGKMTVYNDFTALGVKAFTMDYPLDPTNKTLMHAAVESNEVLNSYSGNIVTDASGKATVSLPEYFEAINKDYRYQLTVIGSFAQAIINKEVSNNKFEIATSIPNVKVSWEVKGVRNDARMKMNPFTAVQDKPAAQRGKYLDPKSHNQPESKGVSYDANMENSSLSGLKPVANKVAPASTGGSLDQPAIVAPVVTNKADNSGSLGQPAIVAPVTKSVDTNGSVAPVEKKADTKQTPATKGGSLDEMPKPVETKKVSTDPGSTKTE